MSLVSMDSTLKLNYHRERFTYNINWYFPCEAGNNFLMRYSKLTKQKVFRSEKISFTSGLFQGPGKYLEFILLVESESSDPKLFIKMCYEINDKVEDFEGFEISNVTIIYIAGSGLHSHPLPILFSTINVDGSTLPILKVLESEYPKEENTCLKWFKNGYQIKSAESVKRFQFSVEVMFERWRNPSPLEREHTIVPVTHNSPKLGQLNTSDLLFSPNWSDVTIYCGVREFPAHVLILQNTSSVLRVMFSQPMVENLTRKLKIEDAEPETVEDFLRFIYTGTVSDMAKNSVGLFAMAEKYDVQNLRSVCENFISSNISEKNALERYNLGKLLNSEAITSKCVQEIKKNRKTIWKTEDEFCEACQKFPKLFYELFYN